jgi:hypothetical protein
LIEAHDTQLNRYDPGFPTYGIQACFIEYENSIVLGVAVAILATVSTK